jgi:hypothetical protein
MIESKKEKRTNIAKKKMKRVVIVSRKEKRRIRRISILLRLNNEIREINVILNKSKIESTKVFEQIKSQIFSLLTKVLPR